MYPNIALWILCFLISMIVMFSVGEYGIGLASLVLACLFAKINGS